MAALFQGSCAVSAGRDATDTMLELGGMWIFGPSLLFAWLVSITFYARDNIVL